ncbi:hypothetical protein ACFS5M_08485 [Lacinutrix iliipiscaria]|uniref:Uncharacterized protein n=1 Tax=Lacinutrix iliipiscaria TaxID=1230532 RepID=A0ABW5WQV8_9FLAO
MKFLLKQLATAIVAITLFNCSVEQLDSRSEENAQDTSETLSSFTCSTGVCGARLTNNGTLSVDLAIYDHNNMLLFEELNIASGGGATTWQSFPTGRISYTVTTPATSLFKTVVIDMADCMVYDMEVAENNMLVTDQPTLQD